MILKCDFIMYKLLTALVALVRAEERDGNVVNKQIVLKNKAAEKDFQGRTLGMVSIHLPLFLLHLFCKGNLN